MFRVRKIFKFEGAHVLDESYSKDCQEIHGHSYVVEVFAKSQSLNSDGMVIDFGKVKDIVKPIIDSWDHAMIVSKKKEKDFSGYKVVSLPGNPTAETMAFVLYKMVKPSCEFIYKIRIHETATGWAEYEE